MRIHEFGSQDPLEEFQDAPQGKYLRCYLSDLGAKTVLEESRYFDRDYLAEFAAYYSTLADATSNRCRRRHFFKRSFSEGRLEKALAGDVVAREFLQEHYLGFTVVRPITHAPFGRTVLRWYPDSARRYQGRPRIVEPSRSYEANVAGVRLNVTGLAWQQQDGAVALCATTALWSLLHSSAFDAHHAIPTTAEVTRFAYENTRPGGHVFPASDGLQIQQMVEAIARAGLTPFVLDGDLGEANQGDSGFRREKFAPSCAVLIRSGFPVLVSGRLEERGHHVICATGFREASAPVDPRMTQLQDADIEYLYVHDDNLGPNVRMQISEEDDRVVLRPKPPPKRYRGRRLPDPTRTYPVFTPEHIIGAVHEGLRVTPNELHSAAMSIGANLRSKLQEPVHLPVTVTARFVRVADYLETVAAAPFGVAPSDALARIRRRLTEDIEPMSLYVGIVRVGYGPAPVADVLLDTSGRFNLQNNSLRVPRWRAFATLLFHEQFRPVFEALDLAGFPTGTLVGTA